MIQTFADKHTAAIFDGLQVRRLPKEGGAFDVEITDYQLRKTQQWHFTQEAERDGFPRCCYQAAGSRPCIRAMCC